MALREVAEMGITMEKNNPPHQSEKTQQISKKKGGFRAMPFIIANETFEKVASFGLLANMVLYLTNEYNLEIASAANILFIWYATSNFVPVIGAFLSDSYLGRFRVITLGSIASLLGMSVLWVTAILPRARPPTCNHLPPEQCKHPNAPQLALLFLSYALMSIGAGGIRPCSLVFGADQLNQNHPNKERTLQSFFSWYYVSVGFSIMISVTVIVYIQENKGWDWGFGVPVILMFLATSFFLLGSSLYVKKEADASMFTGLAMVVVAAVRNRNLQFPVNNTDGWYHHKGSGFITPTDKLRFLNKACIIRNPGKDLNTDGSSSNPWNLCTVEQVENLKKVIRIIPIWSTGIMIALTINQHSFPVLQANTMDRHLGRKFQIPAGSFSVFGILTLTLWIAIYDRLIVPIVCRFTGKQYALTLKQRMGIGLLVSCVTMATSATVERARRQTAIEQGLRENGYGLVHMSAMWLVPQHCLSGLAEAFHAIGQIQFFYNELPKSMASVAVALFSLGMAVGNLMGSLVLGIVDGVTGGQGKESWVANNLNKGHYDYYYWLLCVLSFINFGYYVVCSWAYGPVEEKGRVLEEKTGGQELDEGRAKEFPVISY